MNVLISRAKRKCEVFSSITDEDIDLERGRGRGVAALKAFLSFTRTGRISIAHATDREEDSPFEESVRAVLQLLGYEVECQVGIAGFFIDLAVVDRKRRGRYILGIECDGAAYHSSRSARDRDRLRQAVLEDHGWIIHRIWSTDWFQNPKAEEQKLVEAIDRASSVLEEESSDSQSGSATLTIEATSSADVPREPVLEMGVTRLEGLSEPYAEASVKVPKHLAPHQLGTSSIATILMQIIEVEAPVHEEEAVARIRTLWELGRAGSRIQDAVHRAIKHLLVNHQCRRENGFLFIDGRSCPVRNRANVSSLSLRKPEMIPPEEIRTAIMKIIDVHHGALSEEIPVAVSRLFGFKNTSAQLRETIGRQSSKLLRDEILEERDGMLQRRIK